MSVWKNLVGSIKIVCYLLGAAILGETLGISIFPASVLNISSIIMLLSTFFLVFAVIGFE